MTVIKSNVVTTADDLDQQVDYGLSGTYERVIPCRYTAAGAIADNTVLLMCEVPVEGHPTSIRMWSDDLGDTGALNLGLYPGKGSGTTIADDSDAVDEDCIGTAINVNTAATANVEMLFETDDFNTLGAKFWEIAGLSAKPAYETFYLAFTASAATTAAGDVALVVRFTG